MNRSRLLLIGLIALAAGGFVSYAVYRSLPGGRGPNLQGVEALVAARDIQVGSKLEEADLKTARFLPDSLPQGAYRSNEKDKVLGRGAVLPMTKGEFILPEKLAGEQAGSGLTALIPPGMRAVAVRTNEVGSVAGFVAPGTRVDVLYTSNPTGAAEPVTTTVLENVLVIAAGGRLERGSGTGEAQTVPVVTLLVSPDDAQKLAMAQQEGKIQLSLRSPLDTDQETPDALAKGSLYRGGVVAIADQKPKAHVVRKAPPAPAVPYKVEVYKGNKKEDKTFPPEPTKEQ
jgi:pilus assembly protein CpaB